LRGTKNLKNLKFVNIIVAHFVEAHMVIIDALKFVEDVLGKWLIKESSQE
jgi:hypothetical protein